MTRNELQEAAARRLQSSKRLICQWATGTGKTNVALKFIQNNPDLSCLVLVPEQDNIKNWQDEFVKFNVPQTNVTIICYASLHKYKNSFFDFLVFDEVPHVDTEKRTAICRSIRGEYILALGAVVTEDERATLEMVYGKFDHSIITIPRAIELGFLPAPTVHILHLEMDNEKREHWYKGRALTEKELYAVLTQKVENSVSAYNNNASKLNKRRMLSAGSERKRFLGARKEEAMKAICSILEKRQKRFICFCSSIKQAEALGKDNAYTSKSQKSMAHLERFNNHEINSLYVVGKLIEGQNLNDIDCGVIGQLGGTQRITVQELGRIFRSENPEVFIPVFDDTKDDSFLYTLTSSVPADYIKHHNF